MNVKNQRTEDVKLEIIKAYPNSPVEHLEKIYQWVCKEQLADDERQMQAYQETLKSTNNE